MTENLVPIAMDRLVEICGHFNSRSPVNNGYGCNHPEQEDQEADEDEKEHGRCFSFTCPIAMEMHASEPLDKYLFDILGEKPEDTGEGEWNGWP